MSHPAAEGSPPDPDSLLVVGAAAGMGRWLTEHVLVHRRWERIVLADVEGSRDSLEELRARLTGSGLAVCTAHAAGESGLRESSTGALIGPLGPRLAVCLAVPIRAVASVSEWLAPLLRGNAYIVAVSERQGPMLERVRRYIPESSTVGLHPLFDPTARTPDGQTFALLADHCEPGRAPEWMFRLIESRGGIAQLVTPGEHDAAMAYIQAMTHAALISFVDGVTSAPVDLEVLWKLRTPLFESTFGLGVRAIAEHQQAVVSSMQVAPEGRRTAQELQGAMRGVAHTVQGGDQRRVEDAIAAVRNRFSGALFETIRATAQSAVSAAQAKRAELAMHRRLQSVVGVRSVGRPDALHVGRVVGVTSLSVTLQEEMFGAMGHAALVDERGRRNARRVGINQRPRSTRFGLGRIELVHGVDLERELDRWLATIRRDIRFLVPESVAGSGVLALVTSQGGIRDASVVSEVVRTGQRSVVVRVAIRADHDVEDMVEVLRERVQRAYVWPAGIAVTTSGVTQAHYLGPAGTFSEGAARQAVESAGIEGAVLKAHEGFDAVLDAVDDRSLGIIPISSSATGLVTRAARALLDHRRDLVVGGVVDVAVRFDAYVRQEHQLEELRGAAAYSHPQALGQCHSFIERWGLVPRPCSSTAEALELVARDEGGSVALARANADAGSALKVAEREIDDLSGSITRFLIIGHQGSFGDLSGGWDPTLRHVWVAERAADLFRDIGASVGSGAGFDEILTAASGEALLVTSRDLGPHEVTGTRYLGHTPWSPRTPLVRAG